MCGIAGFFSPLHNPKDYYESVCRRMTDSIVHRGPDDSGTWVDEKDGIAFGHRRLSIVDLSKEGHQPMQSASGRYLIIFNGEVFNFQEIRKELEKGKHSFRGHSDTEVMLAAIEEWGLRSAVGRFIGMFAFALWDKNEKKLFLVRDRLGIKPLYYGWAGKHFVFGSELKALKAYPGFDNEINRDALSLFFRHNYIPSPYSIYKNVWKLEPGKILSLSMNQLQSSNPEPEVETFWSAQKVWEEGAAHPWRYSEQEAVEQLDSLLRDAIRLRMIADVPLGAFLSGGIDSSTVVALMQAQSSRPVKTFSIGFHIKNYNEAHYAKEVARHLGTEHTELYVTPEEAMTVIPKIAHYWDEPFSDSSQIPTYLVSELTRRYVTVSLSGDGGDELFAGYPRYFIALASWNRLKYFPPVFRTFFARGLRSIPASQWDSMYVFFKKILPKALRLNHFGEKVHILAGYLDESNIEGFYRGIVSHFKNPSDIVLNSNEPEGKFISIQDVNDNIQRMTFWDSITYLPDDILIKVDRASMAVSLEARVPLLDHRIVEFAAKLPTKMKARKEQGKWLLRKVLYKYVPEALVDRPKMGFGVPIDEWLRGDLRDWAEDLLDERKISQQGYLKAHPVRTLWEEHISGKKDWSPYLWDILMFQAWLEAHG